MPSQMGTLTNKKTTFPWETGVNATPWETGSQVKEGRPDPLPEMDSARGSGQRLRYRYTGPVSHPHRWARVTNLPAKPNKKKKYTPGTEQIATHTYTYRHRHMNLDLIMTRRRVQMSLRQSPCMVVEVASPCDPCLCRTEASRIQQTSV